MNPGGELVRIDDTSLFVVERGAGYPMIVLHGGPGGGIPSMKYLQAVETNLNAFEPIEAREQVIS